MSKSRRYEILLPTLFNDGTQVPDELIGDVLLELRKQFHAISSETQLIRGIWEHEGEEYRDELVRIFADVADTDQNQQFFAEYKEKLKEKFQQIDIWVTSYPIDII